MPDINPAALSQPANMITPTMTAKSLSLSTLGGMKVSKSQAIPQRIDLEPIYTGLKVAINPEHWMQYKEAVTGFFIGRFSHVELRQKIEHVLEPPNSDKENLHNQLLAAVNANVSREMPDPGPAPWVSANDKPMPSAAAKPVSGDAAERRLKGDVMQLPARDRRRIKDVVHNDFDAHESLSNAFMDGHRRASTVSEVPMSSVGGINKMNLDLEIRKRYAMPLAIESGEFPDVNMISGKLLPICYEAGLSNGPANDAAQLVSIATEIFIKETLTAAFSRTRSNPPGEEGAAGFGGATTWVQTQKYRKQLSIEEKAAKAGELTRDKNGLLPVEYKAAAERQPLGMADFTMALDLADLNLSNFPIFRTQVLNSYKEGELERWEDYTWYNDEQPELLPLEFTSADDQGNRVTELPNGHAETNGQANGDAMDIDDEAEQWWDGAEHDDTDMIDSVLDNCLLVGS